MVNEKELVVVLGPHRSGTSLTTAAVVALGAEAGLTDNYANEENQRGFYEHPDIVELNEELLAALGTSWDNPLFEYPEAADIPCLASLQERAAGILSDIAVDKSLIVLKDPRLCQLLPFWLPLFENFSGGKDRLKFVHTYRDPVEVASSQRYRATHGNSAFYELGKRVVEGAALWMSLSAQALRATVGYHNYFVRYDDLIDAPSTELERLAAFLGVDLPAGAAQGFEERVVDPGLHRSRFEAAVADEVFGELTQLAAFNDCLSRLFADSDNNDQKIKQALKIYFSESNQLSLLRVMGPSLGRLSAVSRSDRLAAEKSADQLTDLTSRLEELQAAYDKFQNQHKQFQLRSKREYTEITENLRAEISRLQSDRVRAEAEHAEISRQLNSRIEQELKKLADLQRHQDRTEADRAHLAHRLDMVESSFSWRVTSPLRAANAWRQGLKGSLQSRWAAFRLKSVRMYHSMQMQSPRAAWLLRRLVAPVYRITDLLVGVGKKRRASSHDQQERGQVDFVKSFQDRENVGDKEPLVSIIVPNYNHAAYLERRLNSIYGQTYTNTEVILLDDHSADGSLEILERYAKIYPEKTRIIANPKNSGSVFRQWSKGFQAARGELVWIAESDDWCSTNFLATLVPFFADEAVRLAYSSTIFMNGDGDEQVWSINEYLDDLSRDRWHHEFVETAHTLVNDAFSKKNIVPNVSSAVFANPGNLTLLESEHWQSMKVCGDWIFYLHLIRSGMVAYSPRAVNYYRMHGRNTSVSNHRQRAFYLEHQVVAETVNALYRVDDPTMTSMRAMLTGHWQQLGDNESTTMVEDSFDSDLIVSRCNDRKPNVLMASYGFCSGGGETFAVELANVLHHRGVAVTFLDCGQEPRQPGLRSSLDAMIPVVTDFRAINEIVGAFGIELIHSHHAWVDNTLLDLLPENCPAKTVVTLHGMYETINKYDLRGIIPRLVARTSAIIYVAEKNLDVFSDVISGYGEKFHQIDNALEPIQHGHLARKDLGISEAAFVFVVASRAIEEKGWSEAIAAVDLARRRTGEDIVLVLVGDGPEYQKLRKLDLPGHVRLVGFSDDVRAYFSLADAGLLPTRFQGESFPLTIIECLQSGRPVLASNVGEIRRMLSTETGLAGEVVELDHWRIPVGPLAEAMARFATDKDHYDRIKSAVTEAAAKFDPDVLAGKHEAVYELITAKDTESV